MRRWWPLIGLAVVVALGAMALAFTIGKTNVPLLDLEGFDVNTQTNQIRNDRTVTVTNGTKHSIPLEDIVSGGPPKDGIPSIDQPRFVSTVEGDRFLDDAEPGLAYMAGGASRFYPFQILVWHEIVNDTLPSTTSL